MASSARIDELRKKFEENPRRYFAPLANEYRKAGEVDQAITICREYLPQQPGHMSGHIVYGQALYESRQFEEAKAVFETALSLDPENLIALRHLGDIALILGDSGGARAWYRRVLEADPRNEEIQAQLASLDQAASQAPTPAVGAGALGAAASATGGRTPSSAATVVLKAVPRPGAAPAAPAARPQPPTTATSPTAEIVVDAIVPPQPESLLVQGLDLGVPAEPSTPALEGLQATAAAGADAPPMNSFSLDGLETTSFAAETPSDAPSPVAAPPPDLDFGAAAAAPASSERQDPPAPMPLMDFGTPDPVPVASDDPAPLDLELGSLDAPPPPVVPSSPSATASAEPSTVPELDLDIPAPPPPPPMEIDLSPPSGLAMELDLPGAGALSQAQLTPLPELEISGAPFVAPADELEVVTPATPADVFAEVSAPQSEARDADPFLTQTMAELYLQQGHREEALRVYRALSAERPDDAELRDKVERLERPEPPPPTAGQEIAPAATRQVERGGPTIRDVLHRIALRRPGYRAEAPQSGSNGNAVAPIAAASRLPNRMGGDALAPAFGFTYPGESDERAAVALALAFSSNGAGNSADEASSTSGAPARTAPNELTLDSVFGAQPPAPAAQSFSFDQFFSRRASAEHAVGMGEGGGGGAIEPGAAESQADATQFTQWLEGLKRR
ncbi:MAG: tetratricopeptide repeat protein [Gemmatimonadaceae bacterium]